MDYIIKNAKIVDKRKTLTGDLWISNGKIKKISNNIDSVGKEIIDGEGKVVMPSFIDMHVHLREPGQTEKEDLITGEKAAVKGGFTHVCAMANTNPVCDNKTIIEYILNKHKENEICGLTQISALTKGLKGEEFVDIDEMLEFTNLFSDDGVNVDDDELFKEALKLSKEKNFKILTHCEPEAETIKRDLKLIEEVGGNLHICHISLRESLDLIKEYKNKGLKFSCEVMPHHIFEWDNDYRVNPPFATKDDRDAMIEGIKEGIIDVIATDHAPHTKKDKENGAPGISGIEEAFSYVYTIFKEEGISLNCLSEKMSYTPSKLLGLDEALIEEGKDANLVLVNLNESHKINTNDFVSKGKNTPFEGRQVYGKILKTIKNGEIVYKNEERKYDNR
ncbi:dihydroorotase [Senegalia massiliensis]|uniref:dihydroorotase n=1 Tax=Senegalia massiliensis TaxID=1720316 RepID=UPI0010307B68|nr:dihydroorotase [Senegalia massiliensis]